VGGTECEEGGFGGDDTFDDGTLHVGIGAVDDVGSVGEVGLFGDLDGVEEVVVLLNDRANEVEVAGDVAGGRTELEDEIQRAIFAGVLSIVVRGRGDGGEWASGVLKAVVASDNEWASGALEFVEKVVDSGGIVGWAL
jgi:hypothetical protein